MRRVYPKWGDLVKTYVSPCNFREELDKRKNIEGTQEKDIKDKYHLLDHFAQGLIHVT